MDIRSIARPQENAQVGALLTSSLSNSTGIQTVTIVSAFASMANVPQALTTVGFMAAKVKTLTLLSPHGDLKIECTATASSDQECMTELLAEAFPSENPLKRNWLINSVHINLYYPPEPRKMRSKVITI